METENITEKENEEKREKLVYQRIMDSRADRRITLSTRIALTALLAGASATFAIASIALGIIFPLMIGFIGTIWVLTALRREQTIMVFDTRAVIKTREKRSDIDFCDMLAVKYKRAFYEKDLATGTITITVKQGGRKKRYKMRHIFDGKVVAAYLNDAINNKEKGEENG